jgi:hypothetical protein
MALPTVKELDALVDWMRLRGVTHLSASGVHLELGAEPAKPPEPEQQPTEAEMAREGEKIAARNQARVDAWDYAASEGLPPDFNPNDEPTWAPGTPH